MMLPDEELVKEIIENNDTLLFGELYDRFSERVYNKCLGYAKDTDEAQDITQDVFLKLFVKLKSFNEDSKFSTWLYSVTKNHCINYVSRNTAKKIQKTSVYYLDVENVIYNESDYGYEDNRSDTIINAMDHISIGEKNVLLLKYRDSLTIKDISKTLKIGESAVKMRLKRAKEKLKDVMPIAQAV